MCRVPAMDGADARIDLWKRSLLDLSLRNRLLDARDGTRAIAVGAVDPIAVAAALGGGLALELVAGEGTLADRRLPLVIGADELERRLTIMSRALREGLAEGGVHTLWLGLGVLVWREADEIAEHRAPLALWPVTVKRTATRWTLAAAGDDARLNDTLVEKLRVDLGVTVADDEDGDGELDLAAVMARFEAAIAGRAGWAIEPGAVLGVFSFAKLAMWTDLGGRGDAAWLRGAPVVAHLTSGAGGPLPETAPLPDAARLDERPIADALMPLDCDSEPARGGAGRRRRRVVRAAGPARHRQVADDHQPDRGRARARQDSAVRVGEDRGARGRRAPARGDRPGLVLSRAALAQGRQAPRRRRARGGARSLVASGDRRGRRRRAARGAARGARRLRPGPAPARAAGPVGPRRPGAARRAARRRAAGARRRGRARDRRGRVRRGPARARRLRAGGGGGRPGRRSPVARVDAGGLDPDHRRRRRRGGRRAGHRDRGDERVHRRVGRRGPRRGRAHARRARRAPAACGRSRRARRGRAPS